MNRAIELSEHAYALPIETDLMGGLTVSSPVLILDEEHGATLIDTGIPGMKADFQAALEALGMDWSEVNPVTVTHHDLDHIGSLPDIVEVTGADMLALEAEVSYVQGE